MGDWSRIDLKRFSAEIDQLRAELDAELGPDDFKHLKKMEWWGRSWTAVGYAVAWLCPNPLSIFALSFGHFIRWAVLAHHTLHRGYDRAPGVPRRYTSQGFARGWRRVVDWLDWIAPEAWRHEHNLLHHCRLNEDPGDPDLVEALVEKFGPLPRPTRWLLLAIYSVAWKPLYYGPNTLRLYLNAAGRRRPPAAAVPYGDLSVMNPLHPYGRQVWLRCWLPYAAWKFGVVPALFLPLGWWAWLSVLINSLLAEALTNFHSFVMIVPNHAGDDLYRFDAPVSDGKSEFYLRQIVGSANYRCGGDGNDLLHGWLNYQIEHHVWPDLTLRQYQRAQPRLKALCAKYGVPYVQESVFRRFWKMVAISMGDGKMKRLGTAAPAAPVQAI
jgi:fatty acid desaturase